MKKLILLILLSSCMLGLAAQDQFNGWLATFNTFKTGKKTSIHNDIQYRSADQLRFTQSYLLRAGLNYHLNKRTIVTAGYAFIQNYRSSGAADGYLPEHRIWEQLLINMPIGHINIAHRFRIEQRYLSRAQADGDQLKKDGSMYANRFRYFVRSILPLKGPGRKADRAPFSKGFFAAVQNEVFLNFGNKNNVNGKTFDQNRFYAAFGYRMCKSVDVEAGYLNQYIKGRNNDVNNHVAQLASYFRF